MTGIPAIRKEQKLREAWVKEDFTPGVFSKIGKTLQSRFPEHKERFTVNSPNYLLKLLSLNIEDTTVMARYGLFLEINEQREE